MLAILINRAKNGGQISRLILNIIDDGLSILLYADDTILFMEHNFDTGNEHEAATSGF
jgi:hypothetical protein